MDDFRKRPPAQYTQVSSLLVTTVPKRNMKCAKSVAERMDKVVKVTEEKR
jgi:hypothetical protein